MTESIVLTFVLLAVGLTLTLPMFIVLTGTAFVVFAATTSIPLSILPQRLFAGLESFPLMAMAEYALATGSDEAAHLARRHYEVLDRHIRARSALISSATQSWSEEDRAALTRLLSRLADDLEPLS